MIPPCTDQERSWDFLRTFWTGQASGPPCPCSQVALGLWTCGASCPESADSAWELTRVCSWEGGRRQGASCIPLCGFQKTHGWGISGWSWLHPWWRRLVGPGGCGKGQGTVAQPGLGAGRRAGPCCWHVQWKLPFPADGKLRVAGGCPRAPAVRGVRPPTHTSVTSQLRAWQCSARRGMSPPNTGLQVLSGARSGRL